MHRVHPDPQEVLHCAMSSQGPEQGWRTRNCPCLAVPHGPGHGGPVLFNAMDGHAACRRGRNPGGRPHDEIQGVDRPGIGPAGRHRRHRMSRWTLRGDAPAGRGDEDEELRQPRASLGHNDVCIEDESRRATPSCGSHNHCPGRTGVNHGLTPRRWTTPIGLATITQTTCTRLRPAGSRTAPRDGRNTAARPTACPTSVPPTTGDTANISLLPSQHGATE
jgi:hypothetical protein